MPEAISTSLNQDEFSMKHDTRSSLRPRRGGSAPPPGQSWQESVPPTRHLLFQRERIHERCKTICPIKEDVDAVSSATSRHGDEAFSGKRCCFFSSCRFTAARLPPDKSRAELDKVPKVPPPPPLRCSSGCERPLCSALRSS